MQKAVILGGARTPIGSLCGALQSLSAVELGSIVVAEALRRAAVGPEAVDDVVMGNVLQAGLGQNPARQCALKAGLPVKINAVTVNKVCGSGLQAVMQAVQSIMAGDPDIVVAGGMESMSRAPYLLEKARTGYRLGDGKLVDSAVRDGLWDIFGDRHMGMLAEGMATRFGISRMEQDQFATTSQARCAEAVRAGRFAAEIVPVSAPQPKGAPVKVEADEYPKPNTTVEILQKLKPAFTAGGTVTAGNSSGVNDGAAAVVLASSEKAKALGLKPIAEVVSYGAAGLEPADMGLGPVPATRKALAAAGLASKEIGIVELNEAFAAQSLAVIRELGLDHQRVNVNGGAIALGHPIGASGARILVTLLSEMKRRGERYGLATLCIGGGEGIAMVVRLIP